MRLKNESFLGGGKLQDVRTLGFLDLVKGRLRLGVKADFTGLLQLRHRERCLALVSHHEDL